jgi:phospholipid-binding lipoprotein MlaA
MAILAALLAGGCAARPAAVQDPEPDPAHANSPSAMPGGDPFALEGEFAEASAEPVIDPLSGYNRLMTRVNDKIYFWLLKPIARGYRAVTPEWARLGVGRFFRNLLMPVRFVNNLLQLKAKRAGTELARFVLNTTIGVLGFGDPAANRFDLQAYPEDFGQTLGHYGVGSGFHIVLPLLGPSNLRDTLGLIPDYFLDPVSYIDDTGTQLAVRAYDRVNDTSLHLGEYESLKKDAVDLYTFLRDGYEQRRIKQIEE